MAKRDGRFDEVGLFLGRDVSLEGRITFEGTGRLDGKFDGQILSGDVLAIGETGVTNAEIKVGTIIVEGEVHGNISATAKIEIRSTGKVDGDIEAPTLVIAEGGVFTGSCKMQHGIETVTKTVMLPKEIEGALESGVKMPS